MQYDTNVRLADVRTLIDGLARVCPVRLPGWGPQNRSTRWMESAGDRLHCCGQRYSCIGNLSYSVWLFSLLSSVPSFIISRSFPPLVRQSYEISSKTRAYWCKANGFNRSCSDAFTHMYIGIKEPRILESWRGSQRYLRLQVCIIKIHSTL